MNSKQCPDSNDKTYFYLWRIDANNYCARACVISLTEHTTVQQTVCSISMTFHSD